MTKLRLLTGVLLAAGAAIAAGPAGANTCVAGKLTCVTTMPVDGYCECSAHGMTEGGTVVPGGAHHSTNSHAGGCGDNPTAPGCR